MAVLNPFGFKPVRHHSGGEIRTQGFERGIADNYATPIYLGQPVKWSSGYLVPASAGDTNIFGIFAGCRYDDPSTFHNVQFRPYYPGSATAKNIVAHVHSDPWIIFQVQSTTAAITDRGGFADFTGSGGNTTTGDSATKLGSISGTKANFYVLDRFDIPENDWGANVIVEVLFAEHALK